VGVQIGSDTASRTDDPLSIGRTVVAVARQEQITLMAASLAYYLFTALVPLVLFSVIALSLFGHGLLGQLSGTASGTVLPSGVSIPKTLLANTQGRFRAAVLGAISLAWSGLRTFGALDGAFAAVYDEREAVSLVDKAVDAVVVFVTVGLTTVVLALVGGLALLVGAALNATLADRVDPDAEWLPTAHR
jgi:membrane protein